ncbi:MAG: phosphotransferase family protein [Woeseiaceae bacterium]|nr:phosphotransferase family protein [Woeseiaceae bacterium]
MTVTLTPEAVLAGIPGWESATITELKGGLSNKVWRIDKGERSGVLKIDSEPRGEPFNTRFAEAYVQNAAAKAGLAPKVILANDGMYFSEYVEGTVWSRSCLDKAGNLELIAAALKRLHALPLTGRSFDAGVAAKRYVEKITGLDVGVVAKCTDIISSMRLPHNFCCCHNDLVAENIITTPDVMFLDWEYACDNDPFFDLATVVEHHELTDVQVTQLLNAYFGGDGERWREHLEKQRKLYLALLCLWMASRSNSDSAELERVAVRLTTSYF